MKLRDRIGTVGVLVMAVVASSACRHRGDRAVDVRVGCEPQGRPVALTNLIPVDLGRPPEGLDLEKLKADIGTDVARPANGGTGDPYVPDVHDSEDFAEELRGKLAGLGYRTAFAVVRYVKRNPRAERPGSATQWIVDEDRPGHCMTGVRVGDDRVIWVEPQRTGRGGALGSGAPADRDGNGRIGAADEPGVSPTEGADTRVEVYATMAAAQSAGVIWD